jgi:hypothetical protein
MDAEIVGGNDVRAQTLPDMEDLAAINPQIGILSIIDNW